MQKFNYYDLATAYKLMKRDLGITYIAMTKIHYNVTRFNYVLALDEAEDLAGRFKLKSGRDCVLHDQQKSIRNVC